MYASAPGYAEAVKAAAPPKPGHRIASLRDAAAVATATIVMAEAELAHAQHTDDALRTLRAQPQSIYGPAIMHTAAMEQVLLEEKKAEPAMLAIGDPALAERTKSLEVLADLVTPEVCTQLGAHAAPRLAATPLPELLARSAHGRTSRELNVALALYNELIQPHLQLMRTALAGHARTHATLCDLIEKWEPNKPITASTVLRVLKEHTNTLATVAGDKVALAEPVDDSALRAAVIRSSATSLALSDAAIQRAYRQAGDVIRKAESARLFDEARDLLPTPQAPPTPSGEAHPLISAFHPDVRAAICAEGQTLAGVIAKRRADREAAEKKTAEAPKREAESAAEAARKERKRERKERRRERRRSTRDKDRRDKDDKDPSRGSGERKARRDSRPEEGTRSRSASRDREEKSNGSFSNAKQHRGSGGSSRSG
jgi:hypothetical protein